MGNAIINPGRFFEKKITHKQFGMKDPKQPHKDVHTNTCSNQCFDDAQLSKHWLDFADTKYNLKETANVMNYTYCVKTCMKKSNYI